MRKPAAIAALALLLFALDQLYRALHPDPGAPPRDPRIRGSREVI
jgi:hypothetical protein